MIKNENFSWNTSIAFHNKVFRTNIGLLKLYLLKLNGEFGDITMNNLIYEQIQCF